MWLGNFSWLRYDQATGIAHCHVCRGVQLNNKFALGTSGPTSGWRLSYLQEHESSKQHHGAINAQKDQSGWTAAVETAVARAEPTTKSKFYCLYINYRGLTGNLQIGEGTC